nr:hypothetical protein [Micromonospora phaseoli]
MSDLVTDARLMTTVDQQRAGRERGGGAWREGGLRGWGRRRGDGVQKVLRVGDLVIDGGGLRAQGGDGLGDAVGQLDLMVEPVVPASDSVQGAMRQGGDVTGKGIGGVSRIEFPVLNQCGVDPLEPIGQVARDDVLV